MVDEHLLKLSKCHLRAKLDFDQLDQSMKIEQAQKELISYLGSEYRKFDKKHSKLVMFKKIRCSLIQNPYDQVGRRMASNVREMFKEHILQGISHCSVQSKSALTGRGINDSIELWCIVGLRDFKF